MVLSKQTQKGIAAVNKFIKGSYIFYSFLLLGFLNGLLLSIQFVKSQAYFLTYFSAKNLVFAFFAPLLIWYGISFLIRELLNRTGFVRTFLPWTLFLGISLTLSSFFASHSPYLVILWIFVAGVYSEFFRWSIMEMQERYINPSKLGLIYSYQAIWNELGLLLGLGLISAFPLMTLAQLSSFTWFVILLKCSVLYFIFMNPRTLEIHHIKQQSHFFLKDLLGEKIYLLYIFMGLFFGLYKVAQDTIANTFFQLQSSNRIEIQNFISQAMLIGSFLQIMTAYIHGRIIEKQRLSPISTLYITWTVYFLLSLICIYENTLLSHILFLSLSKGFAGIYFPTTARISGSYENNKKISLRTFHFWGAVALTGFIFYFIPAKHSSLVILLGLSYFAILMTITKIKKYHAKDLEKLIFSENLADSVRAAIGLSYLKPQNYFQNIEEVLNKNPHKLLKKQIILGLGHIRDEKSIDRLIQEFNSDREEIQITVVEALKFAKSNKATKFALDLVLSNRKTLTPRVRLNASQIIAALYGEKSIPILMLGLQEDDNRMIANVIDALSQFQSRELIDIYKKYTLSKVPRVKANALIALLKYPDQKQPVCDEILRTLLSKEELGEKISIFYVIGKNKVSIFKSQLLELYNKNLSAHEDYKNLDPLTLSYTQTLSWALLRLGVTEGYQSLFRLLDEITDPSKLKSILHFYVQLEDIEKFDCIDTWMMNTKDKALTQRRLIELFTSSGFDFTEEVSYLNSLQLNS